MQLHMTEPELLKGKELFMKPEIPPPILMICVFWLLTRILEPSGNGKTIQNSI